MKLPALRYLVEFYGTLGVPMLYGLNVYLISLRDTLSVWLPLRVFGVIVGFLGLLIWIISYVHLNKSFGVLPQHNKRVTSGLYQIMKHPMYLGILCTFFGLSFANQSQAGIVFTLLVMTPLLYVRAIAEEKKLLQ